MEKAHTRRVIPMIDIARTFWQVALVPTLVLPNGTWVAETEITTRFVRSSGPGGQNVNKVSTKVELRFALQMTEALTPARKRRLCAAFPSYVTTGGELIITSDRFRSQSMNQTDAIERLQAMIRSIWDPPPPRIKTAPSRASKRRRLGDKRARGDLKKQRARTD
jgi:ribosome-associated protein